MPIMSTDLQLRHELPKLRTSAAVKAAVPSDRETVTHVKAEQDDVDGGSGGEDESYRTPTSKESKIPAIKTCPPAPRKAKQVSCKRKLLNEYQTFFEVGSNKEEMDAFFMSTFPKRSCRCT